MTLPVMTLNDLKEKAIAVAEALQAAPASDGPRHRALPEELRKRFIDVRANLFARGIYDPVLVRFDSATVPQAPIGEIAEQLATVAAAL
jgi:hypothetical protein